MGARAVDEAKNSNLLWWLGIGVKREKFRRSLNLAAGVT
jgi:hypothetical protein